VASRFCFFPIPVLLVRSKVVEKAANAELLRVWFYAGGGYGVWRYFSGNKFVAGDKAFCLAGAYTFGKWWPGESAGENGVFTEAR